MKIRESKYYYYWKEKYCNDCNNNETGLCNMTEEEEEKCYSQDIDESEL